VRVLLDENLPHDLIDAQRNNAQGCQQDDQPTTLGEVMQHRFERFLLAGATGACRCGA